jgi:chemotaxis methyl-accepting protein methylase
VNFADPAPAGASRAAGFSQAAGHEVALSADEESLLRWLFDQAGLTLRDYRTETLKRRLGACLRALRASSVAQARHAMQRNPQLLHSAVSTLVIGVSSFFRDAPVFAAVAERVVPALAGWVRAGRRVRVWSAGCSDGAELYSVAMLLAEAGLLHRCDLLGTDCRADAVDRARSGVFSPEAMKGVADKLRKEYFAFDGASWHVRPWLRDALHWRKANLLTVREPGGWDVVLCRNMAIYLQPAAAGRLWLSLESALSPGGFLILGKAERPWGARHLSPVGTCLYRRGGGAVTT